MKSDIPVAACITPIAGPTIIWDDLLKDVMSATGYSPTRSIDACGLNLAPYAKYLVALEELHTKRVLNPVDLLGSAETVLRHLHFSFAITGTSGLIFKINEATKLDVISTRIKGGRYALVSGNLGEWKTAILELSRYQNPEVQWSIKTLLGFFSQLGLSYVFDKYNRLRLKHNNIHN